MILFYTIYEIQVILCFLLKIQNGLHFLKDIKILKIEKSMRFRCPGVKNFDEIALSRTVQQIQAIFVFLFLPKIRKLKMAAIFRTPNFFFNLGRVSCKCTLGLENFDEIALYLTVKEIEAILCFATFGKNSKIQNGCHFSKHNFFFEIWAVNIF